MFELQALRRQQQQYAKRIIEHDDPAELTPRYIAGADVGFEQQGKITRAVVVILSYPTLSLVEYKIARIQTALPYIPGYLSFRECPALYAAWKKLTFLPQLLLVDGHGIAHPRRLGVACHFGLMADVPTIGIAKKRLYGQCVTPKNSEKSLIYLLDNDEQIGWVWQSKARCNPLFISIGHRVSLNSALLWVQRCVRGYRLPEPIRWADAIASGKPMFTRRYQIKKIESERVDPI